MAKFVENLNLQKALLLNMRDQGRVECIDKTKVSEIVRGDMKEDGGWPIVHLDNGRRIRARLLVRIYLSKRKKEKKRNPTS